MLNINHVDEALKLFEQKCHCSQAVFAAFSQEYIVSKTHALKIGGCFGGGMSKGEVCGACAGALMVLGLIYGKCHVDDIESKIKSDEVCDRFLMNLRKKTDYTYVTRYWDVTFQHLKEFNTLLTIIYSRSFVQKWLNPRY